MPALHGSAMMRAERRTQRFLRRLAIYASK